MSYYIWSFLILSFSVISHYPTWHYHFWAILHVPNYLSDLNLLLMLYMFLPWHGDIMSHESNFVFLISLIQIFACFCCAFLFCTSFIYFLVVDLLTAALIYVRSSMNLSGCETSSVTEIC